MALFPYSGSPEATPSRGHRGGGAAASLRRASSARPLATRLGAGGSVRPSVPAGPANPTLGGCPRNYPGGPCGDSPSCRPCWAAMRGRASPPPLAPTTPRVAACHGPRYSGRGAGPRSPRAGAALFPARAMPGGGQPRRGAGRSMPPAAASRGPAVWPWFARIPEGRGGKRGGGLPGMKGNLKSEIGPRGLRARLSARPAPFVPGFSSRLRLALRCAAGHPLGV